MCIYTPLICGVIGGPGRAGQAITPHVWHARQYTFSGLLGWRITCYPYELHSAAALGRFREQGEVAEREWVGKSIPFTGYEAIAEISPSWYDV